MDDQNNNPGGTAPSEPAASDVAAPSSTPAQPEPVSEPTAVAQEPQLEQKCATCGNAASAGNCVACGLGEVTCTCQPASPAGDQGTGAPVV